MKKYINIIFSLLILFVVACSHIAEKADYPNYTPPSLKYKPRLLYPIEAQENAIFGNPKVMVIVSKTGIVDKVELSKSSGYEILDNAALSFCKDLVFNPAIRNGKPTYSKMEWEIKFNFIDKSWDANRYVRELETLYKKYELSRYSERNNILSQILEKHNDFIQNMKDEMNFNFYIEKVISPDLSSEWKRDWNAWPLSFLLYHDFIQRFPSYDSLRKVKTQLGNALKVDIQYINNMPANTPKTQEDKEYILFRIKQFIEDEYPGILINTSLNAQVIVRPMS